MLLCLNGKRFRRARDRGFAQNPLLCPFFLLLARWFLYHQKTTTLRKKEFPMIKGSCCCQAVQFELTEKPKMVGTCHCSRCRKSGASTIAFIKKETLRWLKGKDQVASYTPSAPYKYVRCFCKVCGSSLGEILSEEANFPVAVNLFDTEVHLENGFHEFVEEKPSWYNICDGAKQHEGHPE